MQCCGMSFKSKQCTCIHVYLKSSLLYGGVIGKLSAYAQISHNYTIVYYYGYYQGRLITPNRSFSGNVSLKRQEYRTLSSALPATWQHVPRITVHITCTWVLTLVAGWEGTTPLARGHTDQEGASIQSVAKVAREGHVGANRGVPNGSGLQIGPCQVTATVDYKCET